LMNCGDHRDSWCSWDTHNQYNMEYSGHSGCCW
jgi:hypothetical protein